MSRGQTTAQKRATDASPPPRTKTHKTITAPKFVMLTRRQLEEEPPHLLCAHRLAGRVRRLGPPQLERLARRLGRVERRRDDGRRLAPRHAPADRVALVRLEQARRAGRLVGAVVEAGAAHDGVRVARGARGALRLVLPVEDAAGVEAHDRDLPLARLCWLVCHGFVCHGFVMGLFGMVCFVALCWVAVCLVLTLLAATRLRHFWERARETGAPACLLSTLSSPPPRFHPQKTRARPRTGVVADERVALDARRRQQHELRARRLERLDAAGDLELELAGLEARVGRLVELEAREHEAELRDRLALSKDAAGCE